MTDMLSSNTVTQTDTTDSQLEAILVAAVDASDQLADLTSAGRGMLLRLIADSVDANADQLVPVAVEESHLGEPRLRGDLARTTSQMRLLASSIETGEYLDVVIDKVSQDWNGGVRPDLRRMQVPLGPVVVFAASNFPFSFSVAGGDTASALAAGCPVVVKVHPAHPRLSGLVGTVLDQVVASFGLHPGCISLVYGDSAGRQVLSDPRIMAGAFTGSTRVGRVLFDIAAARPEPIPFYGELGSLNPVFVTKAALQSRGSTIVKGFFESFTFGAGQLCTKPGFLFLPEADGSAPAELANLVSAASGATLLNDHIYRGFSNQLESMRSQSSMTTLARGTDGGEEAPGPVLLQTTVADLMSHQEDLLQECFGPASVVVTYGDESELVEVAKALPGQLTATIHAESADPIAAELVGVLRRKAGRLVWNGWPTGVAVSWATNHGGPYPATTNSLHTSVGTSAVERFLRPVCYQDFPDDSLPETLREGNPLGVPRRVDPGTP